MLVPTAEAGFAGLVQGNKTLGEVLELLKEDTTEDTVISAMKEKYDALKDKCKIFLDALEHFPEVVQKFVDTVRGLFAKREAEEKAARERLLAEREKAKQCVIDMGTKR